jgi:hypothetical protein
MSLRMLLVDCLAGAVSERITMEVLSNQPFNVPGVSWDMLLPHFVTGSCDPILGEPATVTKNLFGLGFVESMLEFIRVKPFFLIFETI